MSEAGSIAAAEEGVAAEGGGQLVVSVVVINYGTAGLTIQCLESLAPEMEGLAAAGVRAGVVVVDNASPDDSADRIEAAIAERGWGGEGQDSSGTRARIAAAGTGWARLVRSPVNGGFSAGNNVGIEAQEAEFYLLLNSDTIVRPGALAELLRAAEARPGAGIIGPRLEEPDGTPQHSAFRRRVPATELLGAAGTGPVTRAASLIGVHELALPPAEEDHEAPWVSFACVLIRRSVIERVGLMDEGYFMYFEDMDYCLMTRRVGFDIVHWPAARIVHLCSASSGLEATRKARRRRPRYFYQARAHYYIKHFGLAGLWAANVCWLAGRMVSWLREVVGQKQRHAPALEWRDIWIGASGRAPAGGPR